MNADEAQRAAREVAEQRAAYIQGYLDRSSRAPSLSMIERARDRATRKYPNPTYERAIILHGRECDYKVEDGQLFAKYTGRFRTLNGRPPEWTPSKMSRELMVSLLALLDNPTETVEVEA